MSDKDKANILAMLEAIDKITRFTLDHTSADTFNDDEESFDAVLLNFVIIGESVARLSAACKNTYTNIPWSDIKSFRNFVVHEYFGVDAEEVWQIIQNHVPILKEQLHQVISTVE